MRLTAESLLSYQGLHEMDGLAHVRVYEGPGELPVVIVGQFDDNPGTMVTLGIEMVAASIQETVFADGREFRLVSYEPRDMLGASWFRLIEFAHRTVSEDPEDPSHRAGETLFVNDEGQLLASEPGAFKRADFRDPRWLPVDDVGRLVGCEVQTWPRREYTVKAVFGPDGEALRAQLAARNRAIGDQLSAHLKRL